MISTLALTQSQVRPLTSTLPSLSSISADGHALHVWLSLVVALVDALRCTVRAVTILKTAAELDQIQEATCLSLHGLQGCLQSFASTLDCLHIALLDTIDGILHRLDVVLAHGRPLLEVPVFTLLHDLHCVFFLLGGLVQSLGKVLNLLLVELLTHLVLVLQGTKVLLEDQDHLLARVHLLL